MRQRLFKAISCVALMISVFFSFTQISLADDNSYVEILASEEYATFSALEDDDYTGSSIIQVLSQRAIVDFSQYNPTETVLLATVDLPLFFTIGFQVEKGHTYSGSVQWLASATLNFPDIYDVDGFTFFGYDVQSPSDIDVSVYPVLIYPSDAISDFTVNIAFNNWQSTYDGYVYINVCMNYRCTYKTNYSPGLISTVVGSTFITSNDWTGTLKDYSTSAIVDSDGSLINNQTIQQQQIANQQSQQSAQQHDNLVNGYDNAANDSMLADKNSVLQGFEQQQDQAMSNGQQYVADFSANYDTAPLQAMAPAFMMISTWFNDLWGGMGNFSTVLIVGLMLCVAGYILKLKH